MTIAPWSRAQEPLLEARDDLDASFEPAPKRGRAVRGGAALLDAFLYDAPLRTGDGTSGVLLGGSGTPPAPAPARLVGSDVLRDVDRGETA
jgi:hypothetical protein